MPDMAAASFVEQRGYRADSVAQIRDGNMITTDLLPHSVLIASDNAERADAGNGLGQRKRGTAVQNTEGLAGFLVDRHGCLHAICTNVGVSDAKQADKAASVLLIQFLQVGK